MSIIIICMRELVRVSINRSRLMKEQQLQEIPKELTGCLVMITLETVVVCSN